MYPLIGVDWSTKVDGCEDWQLVGMSGGGGVVRYSDGEPPSAAAVLHEEQAVGKLVKEQQQ